jgi:5-methyltetrahydropteroyltriglutamate--homocysteine methyltransferase
MAPPRIVVSGKLAHQHDIQVDDFKFVASHTDRHPKVSIPSPTMTHFRGGRAAIDIESYPDIDLFFEDLAQVYRDEIAALYAAGCRYLQLDDTNLAYLCDPAMRSKTSARGDDPDTLTHLYCRLVNDSISDRPDDMVVTVHLCRGNFKSAWVAQGGYEPVAEILFQEMAIDGFFLEYDDERSGDFAPLRFLPPGKRVVLGLMSSKHPEVEDADDLRRRIDEAARYVPLEQCALSHQCGFSSTEHGNEIAEDDQWRKLERCVEVAGAVWGD